MCEWDILFRSSLWNSKEPFKFARSWYHTTWNEVARVKEENKWVAEAPFCEENYDDKWWEFIIIVRAHVKWFWK